VFLVNEQGAPVIYAGASDTGNGMLAVSSKTGTTERYGIGLLGYLSTTTATAWSVPTTARER
jgi:hypothetical protein